MMGAVPSKNSGPELQVRRALHARGLRYRIHTTTLPVRPDLVLRKWRAVVFVNGCFWHGHGCKYSRTPASNREFWEAKIAGNVARDRTNRAALGAQGWRVFEIWTCQLRRAGKRGAAMLFDELAYEITNCQHEDHVGK